MYDVAVKEVEESKPKTVKFKVEKESDSEGLFSDDDMSYDSSDSDSSDLEVTGDYYTKEMFLKKCVPHCVIITPIVCNYVPCCVIIPIVCCYVPCCVSIIPIVCYYVMSSLPPLYAVMSLVVSSLPLLCHHYPYRLQLCPLCHHYPYCHVPCCV